MRSKDINKQKLIFILGLSRTGSTLLDLTLGNHPAFIGLGEVYQVIRPDFNRFQNRELCSCGKIQTECTFWGPVGKVLRKNGQADIRKRYELVMQVFREIYGDERIPVDSSKLLEAMNLVRQIDRINLSIIYLIRDVRAWTISRLNARLNNPDYFGMNGMYVKKLSYRNPLKMELLKALVPILTKSPVYYFLLWYYQNRRIKFFLRNNNISHFCMSYEELGLYPSQTIDRLYAALSARKEEGCLSSSDSQSHVLIGNVKKRDPKRRKGIVYDNQWMYRNEWLVPAALFRNIMNFNNREVYHNIRDRSIWG